MSKHRDRGARVVLHGQREPAPWVVAGVRDALARNPRLNDGQVAGILGVNVGQVIEARRILEREGRGR